MAFNGSGVFVRVHDWTTDLANTVPVTASRQDAEDDGFATGLSNTICRDGQSTTTARIPFAAGLSAAAGTTASVSYAQTNDLNTGMYFPATDEWGLVAGGTATLTSTSTGVTAPGTFTVTGAATLSSTLAVTGAATLSSTLGVTGNLSVNTNKFTVTAASGNTAIAGTVAVTGAATLSSTLAVTGAATLSSTLAVTGAITGSSTIAGTDITASGALSGATVAGNMVAGEAAMETPTATNLLVAPGNMKFHPGVEIAGGTVAGSSGTSTRAHNCSVGKDATGVYTITLETDAANGNYSVTGNAMGATAGIVNSSDHAVGSFKIRTFDQAGVAADRDFAFSVHGDH